MPRRRSQQQVSFVLDDSSEGVDPGSGVPEPARRERTRRPLTRTARRRRAARLVGLAVGLGTLGVAAAVVVTRDGAAQDDALQTLRSSEDRIFDLTYAPRAEWSVDRDEGEPFTVGDLLVIPGRSGTVGYDLGSGDERWRLDDLTRQVCAADQVRVEGTAEVSAFVCLGQGEEATAARLVSVDGAVVAEVEMDPRRGEAVAGPGGTVLQAARDETGVVVRSVDVRTGTAAWERRLTVREDAQDPLCATEGDAVRAVYRSGTVAVHGCGVLSYLTPGGQVVDEPPGMVQVIALGNGSYLRSSGTAVAGPVEAVSADGTVLWTNEGLVLGEGARDLLVPHLVLLDQGEALLAVHRDGTTAWTAPVAARQVLVRGADVVMVQTVDRETVALDATTGEERWRRAADPASGAVSYRVTGTFTDGFSALLVVPTAPGTSSVTALDLATGDVRWTQEHTGDPYELAAGGGRLLRIDEAQVTAFG
ncbi:outer membrane protein assembly factor BamB family protein [Oerskovia gallyi]|uniref:PQQ-like beta-propeller repeat protein n=1 Tax=Oerskovia gallyi TaxID=2762226 RepID=A0ABR8V725_9CELL|nr:PQQ-binding-like beta-propeller repeat protein [Oerskovia gallyi]MBD8000584.1 PQQ-like beta-propeller repeat protein [Oerskovia gallyi]